MLGGQATELSADAAGQLTQVEALRGRRLVGLGRQPRTRGFARRTRVGVAGGTSSQLLRTCVDTLVPGARGTLRAAGGVRPSTGAGRRTVRSVATVGTRVATPAGTGIAGRLVVARTRVTIRLGITAGTRVTGRLVVTAWAGIAGGLVVAAWAGIASRLVITRTRVTGRLVITARAGITSRLVITRTRVTGRLVITAWARITGRLVVTARAGITSGLVVTTARITGRLVVARTRVAIRLGIAAGTRVARRLVVTAWAGIARRLVITAWAGITGRLVITAWAGIAGRLVVTGTRVTSAGAVATRWSTIATSAGGGLSWTSFCRTVAPAIPCG